MPVRRIEHAMNPHADQVANLPHGVPLRQQPADGGDSFWRVHLIQVPKLVSDVDFVGPFLGALPVVVGDVVESAKFPDWQMGDVVES